MATIWGMHLENLFQNYAFQFQVLNCYNSVASKNVMLTVYVNLVESINRSVSSLSCINGVL